MLNDKTIEVLRSFDIREWIALNRFHSAEDTICQLLNNGLIERIDGAIPEYQYFRITNFGRTYLAELE